MGLSDPGNHHANKCLQFFVTLWDELQTRAKKTSDPANLAGGMSYEQVKDRTSSAVGSDDDGGALFDETIAAFGNRRRTALDFLVAALVDSHRQAFAPYIAKAQWTSISGAASADPAQLAISPGLDEPLRVGVSVLHVFVSFALFILTDNPPPLHRSSSATSTSSRGPSARQRSGACGGLRWRSCRTCCGRRC